MKTMQTVAFKQVDVFTDQPFKGNPLAVILDGSALSTAQMQQIAQWTNLSETTFVLPPIDADASYRVRIFTPRQELPFAGHPSVGTAHALLDAGLLPADATQLVQECGAGLLPLRVTRRGDVRQIAVRAPRAKLHPIVNGDVELLASALGRTPMSSPAPQVVSNGPLWWLAEFADEASLRALQPDFAKLSAITLKRDAVGVAVFARSESRDFDVAVRCFCPADGIPEDPVTGSANACIAAWLAHSSSLPASTYRASQGREIGRNGVLELSVEDGEVWVGGQSVTVIDGSMRIA